MDAAGLARQALEEVTGQVGSYLGGAADTERAVSHMFGCLDPGYVGWHWEVTVCRAARARSVTVSESQLVPGPDALLAPPWVPWSDRVRPGDLGVGDLMPASSDDERLVPVVAIDGDDGLLDWDDSHAWGLGAVPGSASSGDAAAGRPAGAAAELAEPRVTGAVGPARVLSALGREETASRWYSARGGDRAARASAAPGPCLTCGFMVRLSGQLGRMFGVCANEFAPDDGHVVSVDHGCGAHSDPVLGSAGAVGPALPPVDEIGYDLAARSGAAVAGSLAEALDPGLT